MPQYTLDENNTEVVISAPAKSHSLRIGTAGIWAGTVAIEYEWMDNPLAATPVVHTGAYASESYTANFTTVLEPLTDTTNVTLSWTSGTVNVFATIVENR